ncbi:MAG: aminotransferase class I/II-fold pyridoxal phosphate-dependent enzyme [Anaerolineae bacterium]|nr:aminotransferase class I/II-fold pyridoxal phosphate-dependent enzyme [Anaerolineae bacterium]
MKNHTFPPAERIAPFTTYYFSTLSEKIKVLKQQGLDIIRLDIGSPDLMPTRDIIETLVASASKPGNHGYTLHAGTIRFRQAVAHYYRQRFNVTLDAETQITALIGSKEGIFNLCQAFINPGDIVLIPDPAYPVYEAATRIAGGSPQFMPLLEGHSFLPDYGAIPSNIAQQAKMMWLNYPNNPTGAIASDQFLQDTVQFASDHDILIAYDNPYVDTCFDGYHAQSILQVPGADSCAVEFNSLSKTYNMAGWRLGYACGNKQVVSYIKTLKSQMDSANFQPTLDAGTFALEGDQEWLEERNMIYQQRRDLIYRTLVKCGIQTHLPHSTLYLWCKIPPQFPTSESFTTACLEQIGISFAPGNIYGSHGEGYFRISFVIPLERIQQAMERLERWLL